MTARVLVVDDILANVKLLEARLAAEYFEVLTASSGQEAVDICASENVDIVLLDVMMPGMDGYEACRQIKQLPNCIDVPVVMVTALDQLADKVQGLRAGADDFLSKPVDDVALVTRVRNLARVKMLNDEFKMRITTSSQMVGDGGHDLTECPLGDDGRILLIEDHVRSASRILETLSRSYDAFVERCPDNAMRQLCEHRFDLAIVSLGLKSMDGLKLCAQLRSAEKTRHLPIIMLLEDGEDLRLMRGLELGVNDYLIRPIDRNELLARVKTQIKRKRYTELLKVRLEESLVQAVTDPLTGLYNRRYLESSLQAMLDDAISVPKPLTVLVADIDHFKRINDQYGHDVGDKVLKEFAGRLKSNTRGVDIVCRVGGEEFVIIMPEIDVEGAMQVAERIRASIAAVPFEVGGAVGNISVTACVGLSRAEGSADTSTSLCKRADMALYSAKRHGRNRVAMQAI